MGQNLEADYYFLIFRIVFELKNDKTNHMTLEILGRRSTLPRAESTNNQRNS